MVLRWKMRNRIVRRSFDATGQWTAPGENGTGILFLLPVWLHLLMRPFFMPVYSKRKGRDSMQTRVAIIGIIVEDSGSVSRLNEILHEYGEHIIGRMGIPYREKGINIISIAVDAPQDVISSLAGKIGRLNGVQVKTAYSSIQSTDGGTK